jgi:flagellar hook protein FlgE
LFTGLSGLKSHQKFIDVVGNNLANLSTPGYRSARATFSDILSFTLRPGSGPAGNFGGTNPIQVGLGTTVASIDLDISQGTFQDTGRAMDVAIQGRGFFTLTNGLQSSYTRVGTFGIDANSNLVDLRSGLRVVNSSGANIVVPVSDTLPANPTTQVSFQGNLPAVVTGPLEEILQSSNIFQLGTAATQTATGTAPGNQFDLTAFAGGSVLVGVNGGAQQSVTFPTAAFGSGPVLASTVAAQFTVAGLSVTADDVAGTIIFDTVTLGSGATLKFDDGPGSTGLLASMGLGATQVRGTESIADSTTNLAQLTTRNTPYVNGDQITVTGTNPDGSPFSDTFVYGAGNDTLGDLLAFINNTIDSAASTATLDANGNILITATNPGPATLSLFVGDAAGNAGSNSYPSFAVTQNGTGPDTAVTSIEVLDSLGRSHPVTLTFTRNVITNPSTPSDWDLTATMDASEGTIASNTISTIRFNTDGSFNVIGGGSNSLAFDFTGIGSTQTVLMNLGTSGQFDGIAMLGATTTVAATDQDGFGSGTLVNVAFDRGGNLVGFYSNGQSQVLDTLRISVFSNEAGLLRAGNTMFVESPNSDDPISTTAGSAGAGIIRPGAIENSNVDIAQEFVNLIEAQRGFQANSRVITTTDEILAELVNIVR